MMQELIYYNNLYDHYKELLTPKQRKYFEDYYFKNLSLSEMAENYEVSRNAIYKQLQIVIKKLDQYEEKLGLFKKRDMMEILINKIDDDKLKKKIRDSL